MKEDELFSIGIFTKTHGFKGALKLHLHDEALWEKFKTGYPFPEFIFLDIDGLPVPFCIQKITPLPSGQMLAELEDIATVEKARFLCNKTVYIKNQHMPEGMKTEEQSDLSDYLVIDKKQGAIGNVERIIDMGKQQLIQIHSKQGQDILIPFTQGIVQSIDHNMRKIRVETPEGLIDLYKDAQ